MGRRSEEHAESLVLNRCPAMGSRWDLGREQLRGLGLSDDNATYHCSWMTIEETTLSELVTAVPVCYRVCNRKRRRTENKEP